MQNEENAKIMDQRRLDAITDKPDLLPCPFCGSTDIDPEGVASFKPECRSLPLTWDRDATPERIEHRPACTNCDATTSGDWNTRTAPSSQGDTLDALDEAINVIGALDYEALGKEGMMVLNAARELQAIKRSGMLLPELQNGWRYDRIHEFENGIWQAVIYKTGREFCEDATGPTPASAAAEAVKRITTEE